MPFDGFGLGIAWKTAMDMVPGKKGGKGGGAGAGGGGGGGAPGSPGNPINADNYVPNSGVPGNFPGALENHPNWVGDGGENGHCDAHPGGCKDSMVGSGCGPGGDESGTPLGWRDARVNDASGQLSERTDPYNEKLTRPGGAVRFPRWGP